MLSSVIIKSQSPRVSMCTHAFCSISILCLICSCCLSYDAGSGLSPCSYLLQSFIRSFTFSSSLLTSIHTNLPSMQQIMSGVPWSASLTLLLSSLHFHAITIEPEWIFCARIPFDCSRLSMVFSDSFSVCSHGIFRFAFGGLFLMGKFDMVVVGYR